jgi:hypothetical protein
MHSANKAIAEYFLRERRPIVRSVETRNRKPCECPCLPEPGLRYPFPRNSRKMAIIFTSRGISAVIPQEFLLLFYGFPVPWS